MSIFYHVYYHRQKHCQNFCYFITRINFSPVSNNSTALSSTYSPTVSFRSSQLSLTKSSKSFQFCPLSASQTTTTCVSLIVMIALYFQIENSIHYLLLHNILFQDSVVNITTISHISGFYCIGIQAWLSSVILQLRAELSKVVQWPSAGEWACLEGSGCLHSQEHHHGSFTWKVDCWLECLLHCLSNMVGPRQ